MPERKSTPVPVAHMPDLINTGDDLDDYGSQDTAEKQDEIITLKSNLLSLLGDDLFGIDPVVNVSTASNSNPDGPFSDVSFHVTDDKEQNDLFSGLTIDYQKPGVALNITEGISLTPLLFLVQLLGIFKKKQGRTQAVLHNLTRDLCPPVYPQTPMQYGMPPNIMFNQGFVSQPMDYSARSALIAQQQFLLQNLGRLNPWI